MNIALIDDMAAERLRLEQMLREYDSIHQLGLRFSHFSSGEAFLAAYQPFQYAAIFMDIYMDGMTGIETAEKLREIDDDALLVFLTTSESHRPDAFSLFASSYLSKPCSEKALFRTMDHIFHRKTAQEKRFSFSYDRQDYSLRFSDVVALETDGNYLSILARSGNAYRTRMTFSAAQGQLDSRFLTLMKGIIVNMDYILQIQDGRCLIRGGRIFPVHIKSQRELQQKWLNYKFARIRNGAMGSEAAYDV